MKILELRFENLNSLYGAWSIDFRDAAFMEQGVFAITGPTGAGKSTILDAICLALYGRTPRLAVINKSGNEMMSRQAGECYAELLFESTMGRFRCTWSQRRARAKATGALQDYKHEIADEDTGLLVVDTRRKADVAAAIVERVGMDFDRFTRAVLLAQGGFDSFLKSAPAEKAKLLEDMTGSSLYSDVSRAAHARLKLESDALATLETKLSAMRPLQALARLKYELEFVEARAISDVMGPQAESLRLALQWRKDMVTLRDDMLRNDRDLIVQRAAEAAFAPNALILTRAQQAADLDVLYLPLQLLQKAEQQDVACLNDLADAAPRVEKALHDAQLAKDAATRAQEGGNEAYLQATGLWAQVEGCDRALAISRQSMSDLRASLKQADADEDTLRGRGLRVCRSRALTKSSLWSCEEYLASHAQDACLVTEFSALKNTLADLAKKRAACTRADNTMKACAKSRDSAKSNAEDAKLKLDVSTRALSAFEDALNIKKEELSTWMQGSSLADWREICQGLSREKDLRLTMQSLAEHRKNLEDGKACPLCGALEHPFALANVPSLDETAAKLKDYEAKIKTAGDLNQQHQGLLADFQAQQLNCGVQTQEFALLNLTHSQFLDSCEAAVVALEYINADYRGDVAALRQQFELLGLDWDASLLNVADLESALEARLQGWNAQVQIRIDLQAALQASRSSMKTCIVKMRALLTAHADLQARLETQQDRATLLRAERLALFADKLLVNEKKRFAELLEGLKKSCVAADACLIAAQADSTRAQGDKASHAAAREARAAGLTEDMAAFAAALEASPFALSVDFMEARLESVLWGCLKAEAKALREKGLNLRALREDKRKSSASLSSKNMTEHSLEELDELLESAQEKISASYAQMGACKQALGDDDNLLLSQKDSLAQLELLKLQRARWARLDALIGSADGKKYRNFVQGLSLGRMVAQANRQLAGIHGRYLLARDVKEPLELCVIDTYQAGERRSTRNLSGGESFIVSLALALGLSQMVSRHLRVDSLFLDEGFGTLDVDSLDMAVQALTSLQHEGKLIGVISHVPAFKDQINVQLQLSPQAGSGKSRLSGPGCASLSS